MEQEHHPFASRELEPAYVTQAPVIETNFVKYFLNTEIVWCTHKLLFS